MDYRRNDSFVNLKVLTLALLSEPDFSSHETFRSASSRV